MTKLKLAAIVLFIAFFSACEKSNDKDENLFTKTGIPMNGSQVVPANASAATGTLNISYNRGTHILDYTITWSGLSGAPAGGTTSFPGVSFPAIGVYGLADATYMANPYPGLSNFPAGVASAVTSGFQAAATGTYTGSIYVDGVVVKEADILNNKFYIQIRTAAFPNGQIRGQVDFR